MEIHSFLELFHRFLVDVVEDVRKTEFQVCFEAEDLNEKRKSIVLHTKNFPGRLHIYRYEQGKISFSIDLGFCFDFGLTNQITLF